MSAHTEALLILVRAALCEHLRDLGLPCAAHVAAVAERATEWSDVAGELLFSYGRAATIVRRASISLAGGDIAGAAELLRTIHGETATAWETRVRALLPPGTRPLGEDEVERRRIGA